MKCLLVCTVCSGLAGEARKTDQVVDGFLEATRTADWLDEEQRKRVQEIVLGQREKEMPNMAISEALREVNPAFASGLSALSAEDADSAVSFLGPLTTSEDPYLAAESAFFLAKAYIEINDHEKALPLLEDLIQNHSDHTLHCAEALFLCGTTQAGALKRVEAIDSLSRFLDQYPDSPPRMLAEAKQNLEFLEELALGSINDIHDQMEYSHRKLTLEDSGKKTQEVQDNIANLLTSLIEELEKCGGQCPGCGSQPGGQRGNQGSQGGNVPGVSSGTSEAARRTLSGGPRTPWADLRSRAREDETFSAMKGKFPARYRQLVEQYYRSLQEDTEE